MKDENVFCFARRDLEKLFGGLPQGGTNRPELIELLSLPQHFIARHRAENDPHYKQIIPYQIFTCNERFFVFQRGQGVGENRLAGRFSLGIGGHINDQDATNGYMSIDDFNKALLREREEEIVFSGPVDTLFIGWINDDSDDVGLVHLAAAHLCKVNNEEIIGLRPDGEDLHEVGWLTANEIEKQAERFEKWSLLAVRLVLPALH